MSAKFDLPEDDLAQLSVAFDMLGRHRFGVDWTAAGDMSKVVRMGQSRRHSGVAVEMGRWAVAALTKCVQNGWLPLIYFDGNRRILYYENPNGRYICDIYVRPVDCAEQGQIAFEDGDMAYCLVNIKEFPRVLRQKFLYNKKKQPGKKRKFLDFDEKLDEILKSMPANPTNNHIKSVMNKEFAGTWPGHATIHLRFNEALDRARRPQIINAE